MISKLFSEKNILSIITTIMIGLSIICILAVIVCAIVGKPSGDDFSPIVAIRDDGWWQSFIADISRSGRYAQSVAIATMFGLFGANTPKALPLLLLLWVITLAYLYSKSIVSRFLKEKITTISIIITIISTFLVYIVNTNTEVGVANTWLSYQMFFWSAAVCAHTFPILILSSLIYWLFFRQNKLNRLAKITIMSSGVYLTGLFDEVFPASVACICIGLIVLSFFEPTKKYLKDKMYFIFPAITSTLALATLLLSSGSQKRQMITGVHARLNILSIGKDCIKNSLHAIQHIYLRPIDIVIFCAAGIIIAAFIVAYSRGTKQRLSIKAWAQKGITLGTVQVMASIGSLSCAFILVSVGYGLGATYVPRTMIVFQVLYVSGMLILSTSIMISLMLRNNRNTIRTIIIIIFIFLSASSLFIINKITTQVHASISYSKAWDDQSVIISKKIESNPNQTIYLPESIASIGIVQTLSCRGGWLSPLVADYYGAKKICSDIDPPGL